MDKRGSGTPTVIEIDGETLHKYGFISRRVSQGWFPFQKSCAQKHNNYKNQAKHILGTYLDIPGAGGVNKERSGSRTFIEIEGKEGQKGEL